MIQVCLHGPFRDPAVIAALFETPPEWVPATLKGASLIGGDCVVPGIGAGDSALEVAVLTLSADQMRDARYVLTAFGGHECARQVDTIDGPIATVTFEPDSPEQAPWQDAENLGWAAILAEAISEVREYAPDLAEAEVASRLPMILSRAASRATAKVAAPKPLESGLGLSDVVVHDRRRPYSRYFTVEELEYSHRKFDGTQSDPVLRAVFMAADAVTVLPYDPVRDVVLLVEQVRAGPIARHDATAWILEPVAGRIEPGDSPETTARKEAAEEAGLDLRELHLIGDYYPSTGCFSEYIYSYIGIADLPDTAAGLGGVLAEGEDIRAHIMTRSELLARIDRNEIPDAPLLVSAWWLDRNLSRLRASG